MPARQPKPTQQPKDAYAQAGKALASQVQRLRGWLSTDASRLPELVDALNALVGAPARRPRVRRGRGRRAGGGEAFRGPAALDRPDRALQQRGRRRPLRHRARPARRAAGRGRPRRRRRRDPRLLGRHPARRSPRPARPSRSPPEAGRHALTVAARVALAPDDVADRERVRRRRRRRSPHRPDGTGFGGVDLDRLASDARWAAGHTEQSLGFLHTAKEAYEDVVGDRLADPGRLAPALAERLTEPLPGLYRDLADRLGAVGERRPRPGQPPPAGRAAARLRGPVRDVPGAARRRPDRPRGRPGRGRAGEEAFDAATEADEAAADRTVPASARLLAAAALARASLAAEPPGSGRPAARPAGHRGRGGRDPPSGAWPRPRWPRRCAPRASRRPPRRRPRRRPRPPGAVLDGRGPRASSPAATARVTWTPLEPRPRVRGPARGAPAGRRRPSRPGSSRNGPRPAGRRPSAPRRPAATPRNGRRRRRGRRRPRGPRPPPGRRPRRRSASARRPGARPRRRPSRPSASAAARSGSAEHQAEVDARERADVPSGATRSTHAWPSSTPPRSPSATACSPSAPCSTRPTRRPAAPRAEPERAPEPAAADAP